jgi:hypothetical protein
MSVHFLSCELSKWDEVEEGALVLTFFADERPLRGAAGLADWRLCGQLSRLIKGRRLDGESGEALLMPPGNRLPFDRILLFGLGSSKDFNEQKFREVVRSIREVVSRAGVDSYAIQPPGRATGLIAARRALELWLEEENRVSDGETEVAIIDTPGGQKEMADILRTSRRVTARRNKN